MNARGNRGVGKSDPLDARRIAAAVLPLQVTELRRPRRDNGERAALQVLLAARNHMTGERTACVNALTALLRILDLGIDARKPLAASQISEVSRWRTCAEDLAPATARTEATRLAKRIVALDEELAANHKHMQALVRATPAAGLLDKAGSDPSPQPWRSPPGPTLAEYARKLLRKPGRRQPDLGVLGQHHATPPQPRRRPALEPRPAHGRRHPHAHGPRHPRLRRAEGRTTKEIRRSLKRYLARQIYRHLNAGQTRMPAT
jgi:transposase